MTKSFGINGLLIYLLIAFGFIACNLEDEAQPHNLQIKDLNISVVENAVVGAELGQVIASAEGAELEFEVLSSEPAGAFVIESSTGVIAVANSAWFDFEERGSLSAEVLVRAGGESKQAHVLVQLEDQLADPLVFNQLTKNWVTSKFSFNGIFAAMDVHSCRLDDALRISGTGKYTYDGGAELCGNEDNQQLKTGTWDLDENLNFIIFDKGEENELKVNIDFFEEGKLSVSCTWMGIPVSGEYLAE